MPAYLAEMSTRLGREVTESDLLDLASSDRLRRVVDDACDSTSRHTDAVGHEKTCSKRETEDRDEALRSLTAALASVDEVGPLWMMAMGSETCGAVRVTLAELVRQGLDLLGDDEDAVRIASETGGSRIRLYADTVAGHAPRRWTICNCG